MQFGPSLRLAVVFRDSHRTARLRACHSHQGISPMYALSRVALNCHRGNSSESTLLHSRISLRPISGSHLCRHTFFVNPLSSRWARQCICKRKLPVSHAGTCLAAAGRSPFNCSNCIAHCYTITFGGCFLSLWLWKLCPSVFLWSCCIATVRVKIDYVAS